jgi:predicted dehydrogenase
MRFALLGDNPDGLDMARALAASGRHVLAVYSGPPVGAEYLRRWGLGFQPVGDLEEVLADPAIDALIIAGSPSDRPAQLRRALRSERHVLCVHPADQAPDAAYEALMIQADTGQVLLPLLPEALHPGVTRMAELARPREAPAPTTMDGAINGDGSAAAPFRLLEVERWSSEHVLLEADTPAHRPGLPGWDVLRQVGGEVAEVSAFAAAEEVTAEAPLLVAGRFEGGGLFQAALVPDLAEPRLRLTLIGDGHRAQLIFPQGWPGPARLTWQDETGTQREQTWESWDPWQALVELFEATVARLHNGRAGQPAAGGLTWRDEVRCLELDDAARRSVARRRTSTLEYQAATEEASFKGTMTLFGCALLWASLALLILSAWVPWLGWLIAPLFGLFLVFQLLRWALPARPGALSSSSRSEPELSDKASRRADHVREAQPPRS